MAEIILRRERKQLYKPIAKATRARLRRKSTRRRLLRFSLITANCLVVIAAIIFLVNGVSPSASSPSGSPLTSLGGQTELANPLDKLSSAEIAATASKLAHMPETTAIVNQSDSDRAELSMQAATSSVLAKPQVVESNYLSNKDIKTYIVKAGDTLASVAKQFNLTEDTLRWSNNLTSSSLSAGQKLFIPPVNGIVYNVASGDTPQSLAARYSASEANIVAYNDAEIGGLKVGEQIIIPDGTKPQPKPVFHYAYHPSYGGNTYDFGYCTWYVANQISVPNGWGNASTWAYYASQTPGWAVSSTPSVGSIAQRTWGYGGAGHVAIVRAVNGDSVEISDMNGIAGWGQVGTAWVSASQFNHFIAH